MNKYGLRLKELREQNGYTQESLAKLLNTSRSRIGMYEQGKRQPDFEMQEAIADLFNVSIDYLFGRESDTNLNNLYRAYEHQFKVKKLTQEDLELIEMYHSADEQAKEMVNRILKYSKMIKDKL